MTASVRFAEALRRADPLAWGGLMAAVVLVAFPPYWVAASLVPLLGGSEGHAGDFARYVHAGLRFRADPLTLYAADDFLYPPPTGALFSLISRLPLAWGYLLAGALSLAALAASLRLTEALVGLQDAPGGRDARLGGWARAAWWAVGTASAASLQNVKFGQVNTVVLLAALVFVRAVADPQSGRRALAIGGGALALGAWLKLYPLALGVFALRRRTWPALAALAATLVLVPLVLLPLVPAALYAEFALVRLPETARTMIPSALNVGLPALVERLGWPAEALLVHASRPPGPGAQAAATLGLAAGIGAAVAAWCLGGALWKAALAALAIVPVTSILGWEYTFALALPAFLVLLGHARLGGLGTRLVAIAAVAAWLVQKPPEGALGWAVRHAPVAAEVFTGRFVVALAALALAVWWAGRPGEKSARRVIESGAG